MSGRVKLDPLLLCWEESLVAAIKRFLAGVVGPGIIPSLMNLPHYKRKSRDGFNDFWRQRRDIQMAVDAMRPVVRVL